MNKIEKVVEELAERTRNEEIDWSSYCPYSAEVEGMLLEVYGNDNSNGDRFQLATIQNGKKHTTSFFPDNLSILRDAIEGYHTPEDGWKEDWMNQVLSNHDE